MPTPLSEEHSTLLGWRLRRARRPRHSVVRCGRHLLAICHYARRRGRPRQVAPVSDAGDAPQQMGGISDASHRRTERGGVTPAPGPLPLLSRAQAVVVGPVGPPRGERPRQLTADGALCNRRLGRSSAPTSPPADDADACEQGADDDGSGLRCWASYRGIPPGV